MADRSELDPVMRAIRETRGQSVLIAEACGIDKAAVYQWKRVPIQWVHVVAGIIKVPPEKIRPDIFRGKQKRN